MRYATLALVMMGVLAVAAGPALAGHDVIYVNHGYHGEARAHHHHHPVYVPPPVIVRRPVVVTAAPVYMPAPPPPAPVYYYPGCGLELRGRHFSVGLGF